ncbi:MAG: hypothetical protein ACRC3H_19555 [Lachnospiraceae bacterium]
MKQLLKRFFFLTMLFSPVLYPSLLSYAQSDPQTEDIVYSLDELSDWWDAHLDTGGRVYLGDNITVSSFLSNSYTNPELVIDTGKYGLIFDGACIFGDNLSIIGEGIENPVVDVYDVGGFYFNWINAIHSLQVTAYGRDSIGGIAVRISQDDPDPVNLLYVDMEGSIQSYGKGAIGVYLAVPLDVYCLNVSVEGAESTAIYSAQGANLYYCKLNAQGNGAASVTGNVKITLNACTANPQADNVTTIDYSIVDTIGRSLYYPVKQYSDYVEYHDYAYTFLLSRSDAQLSYSETLYVSWLPDPNDIDTQTLGRTVLSGTLSPAFQGLGLESQFPLELVVEIRDPAIPCISNLRFYEKVSSVYAILSFWDTYDPNDENVILWRSDDNGQTWYDFTDSPDLEWDGYDLIYYYGEITGTILLQLEVIGVGESNVAALRSTDYGVGGETGGDRTGTDRVVKDGNDESSDPEPEPEPNLVAENPTDTSPTDIDNDSNTKEDTIPAQDTTGEIASKLPLLPSYISEFRLGGFYASAAADNETLPDSDITTEQSGGLQSAESTEQPAASTDQSAPSAKESADASGSAIQRSWTNMYLLLGIILSAACTAVFFGLYLWNKQKGRKR